MIIVTTILTIISYWVVMGICIAIGMVALFGFAYALGEIVEFLST